MDHTESLLPIGMLDIFRGELTQASILIGRMGSSDIGPVIHSQPMGMANQDGSPILVKVISSCEARILTHTGAMGNG